VSSIDADRERLMETETAVLMATDINRRKWRRALMQNENDRLKQRDKNETQ
jgi:hypothetical protein